jgi:hypothetical protein
VAHLKSSKNDEREREREKDRGGEGEREKSRRSKKIFMDAEATVI